jgi:predicted membrane protein
VCWADKVPPMWGWIVLIIGIVYGYMTPGRQDKMALFKKGVLIGIVLAVLFALVGYVTNTDPLGGGLGTGVIGVLISIVFLSIAFVIGAWIGDWIEGAPKRA